jgi:hypothetical protein
MNDKKTGKVYRASLKRLEHMRRYLQAVLIATLLSTAVPGIAQDVETEEMICRDIGDIFCLLEEF